MKLSNFRIKDRVNVKNQRADNQSNETDLNSQD
jgi:hypothetical protein